MDKDVTKPKMLFHKTIHTAKVIRTKLPHKIQNQIEQESQQLIKNLILSNQINNVTPTQIKIQF